MTHDGPEYNGTSENEKFFTILVQNDYLKPEELVSENVQLSDTVLAIRREQFIEYFKEVFRTFDENRYNIILQSHQTNNMVEGTVRENLQLLTEEMISNFVWVLDNPATTQFSILSDHSNLKQLKSSEYRIKYGDDSMWLDRMLDIACPIGPSVESASDDELENHIRSVYGRSTQQIVHFNEIVKKSFSIQETAQRVKGPI